MNYLGEQPGQINLHPVLSRGSNYLQKQKY